MSERLKTQLCTFAEHLHRIPGSGSVSFFEDGSADQIDLHPGEHQIPTMRPNHELQQVNDTDTYVLNSTRLLLELVCRVRALLRCYGVKDDLKGCVGELVFDIAGTFDATSEVLTGHYNLEPAVAFRVEQSGVPGRGNTDNLQLVLPWDTSSLHEEVYCMLDMLDRHPELDTTTHKISLEQLRSIRGLMGLPDFGDVSDRSCKSEG